MRTRDALRRGSDKPLQTPARPKGHRIVQTKHALYGAGQTSDSAYHAARVQSVTPPREGATWFRHGESNSREKPPAAFRRRPPAGILVVRSRSFTPRNNCACGILVYVL